MEQFPTRLFSHQLATTTLSDSPAPSLPGDSLARFVLGQDAFPTAIPVAEVVRHLRDPFAVLVLARGMFPLTLRELLAALDSSNSTFDGIEEQNSYLVADGGQIRWSAETRDLSRSFRLSVTRGRAAAMPDLMVSTSIEVDSSTQFLQVIAWDPVAGAFQFYDRRGTTWIWAGSSWDALHPASRGLGPFDSHVNGALNMKELKRPWIHWHSEAATIPSESLAPDHPFLRETLWQGRRGAQDFEMRVARPGILRWTKARFARLTVDGRLTRLRDFLRQVVATSTVNLVSSSRSNSTVAQGEVTVDLPLTFFFHSDALLERLGLDSGLDANLEVSAAVYRDCLAAFDVKVADPSGRFQFPGDTHFVFTVPEPAFEDLAVLNELLALRILTPKLAACLLMVDFCNPVFSRRRAMLLRHVPDSASIAQSSDFAAAFVAGAEGAATDSGSPEAEFLAWWRLGDNDWRQRMGVELQIYLAAVKSNLQTLAGFKRYFALAESRRREFRKRPLAEFRLTTPTTNIPETEPLLRMTRMGEVQSK